jgi:hypothetical protein
MANKKMTVIEKYTAISEMLNGTYKGEFTTEQALAFLTERIEQTAKKNASRTADNGTKKLTPTQQANEVVKNDLVTHLQVMGCPQTVADIMKTAYCCTGKSNQYVTQMLTQLKNENRVIRTEEKGKSYYSAPSAEETE